MTRAIRPFPLAAVAVVIALLAVAVLYRGGPAYGALDVNRSDDPAPNGCTPEPGGCSLREAIIAANANAATVDTINLPAGVFTLSLGGLNENAAASGDLDILNNLTFINGAGAAATVIDGGNIDRVFQVFLGKTVQMRGLTIQNGHLDVGQGGGITAPASSTVTLDYVVVASNDANEGGGIWNGGALTVTNATIRDNMAYATGGGILNGDSTASLIMAWSTISGNQAGGVGGGGLANANIVDLSNVTISDNFATHSGGGGGGIYNYTTSGLTLTSVTISHNTSTSANMGGGIRNASSATANLTNTIVANNAGGGGNCSSGIGHTPVTSFGHNLDSGSACAFGAAGDINNGYANLGPLADNGGPAFTRALLPGSQAIDTGDNNACPPIDERGVPRPQGVACDMGAYEAGSIPTPTPSPTPTAPPNSDNDGDGWTYANENLIGTDPDSDCGYSGWPADLVSAGTSTNKLDLADLTSFVAPLRRLGTSPGHPNYDRRWDVIPGSPSGAHINVTDLAALLSGPSAYPPMFSGQRAFGQTCSP